MGLNVPRVTMLPSCSIPAVVYQHFFAMFFFLHLSNPEDLPDCQWLFGYAAGLSSTRGFVSDGAASNNYTALAHIMVQEDTYILFFFYSFLVLPLLRHFLL